MAGAAVWFGDSEVDGGEDDGFAGFGVILTSIEGDLAFARWGKGEVSQRMNSLPDTKNVLKQVT